MNNKVVGIIFILFGMGLLGDSTANLYQNSLGTGFDSVKSIIGVVLGIASCVYGFKRTKIT